MTSRPRIAVLVDLPRSAASGGHVKYWERIAQAAAKQASGVDLTVYFSGVEGEERLSENVRLRSLPPVFSTERLKFLPYVPAHTDLAGFHPRLAKELAEYDVLHTTDAYFAFAQTAERISKKHKLPLVTSFHTDTPAYAELFTRKTIEKLLGKNFGALLDKAFGISASQRKQKLRRLEKHLSACRAIFTLRPQDSLLAKNTQNKNNLRIGVDKSLFSPISEARNVAESEFSIPQDKFITLFVGRVDEGKRAQVLMNACIEAINNGIPMHLIVAGEGPLTSVIKDKLKNAATITGVVPAEKLALLYSAANFLAAPSEIEIGGMIGLEAHACGCPVLSSARSGLLGCAGAIKEIDGTEREWAQAFMSLYQDKNLLELMRKEALAFRRDSMAGWDEIFENDFVPVWQKLAMEKSA